MRPGERHAETNALLACARRRARRDGVRLARAVLAPRPPAAVRRRADRRRHRARRLRGRRPVREGRRQGLRAPARGGRRGRARDGRARAPRAPPERAVPHARRRRPPVRAAQARRVARRAHGDRDRREPLDLVAREPRARARVARVARTPSRSAAAPRSPTTRRSTRATSTRPPSASRCASSSTAAAACTAGLQARRAPGTLRVAPAACAAAAARRRARRRRDARPRRSPRSARAASPRCSSRAAPSSPRGLLRAGLVDSHRAVRGAARDRRRRPRPARLARGRALAGAPALRDLRSRPVGPGPAARGRAARAPLRAARI